VTAADLLMAAVAVVLGIPMIVIDLREHRLPNRLTGGAAVLVLLISFGDSLLRADWSRWPATLLTGLGMAAGGYFLAVLARGAFGMGDVKLLGVVGLALGHLEPSTIVVWLLALAVASALWLALVPLLDQAADRAVPWRKRHIAFGPPIIVAWWLVYVVMVTASALRHS
jgi:leader peptidase (prepilin peptidase) / N-methyltransferase